MQPIFADVEKGAYIRISIAGAAWPAIGVNPGTGNKLCEAPGENCEVITISMNLNKSIYNSVLDISCTLFLGSV